MTSVAEYANVRSGGEFGKPAPDEAVTAYQMFYQWVKGTGPDTRNFNENSTMGKQMLQSPEVEKAINEAADNAFCDDVCEPVLFARRLREENPFVYALYDFPIDAGGYNPARGFHGSFQGNVVIDAVTTLPDGRTMIQMTVNIRDQMTAVSGSRASGTVGGYEVENPTAIYQKENPYGLDGQFRTINVNYKMQIKVIR